MENHSSFCMSFPRSVFLFLLLFLSSLCYGQVGSLFSEHADRHVEWSSTHRLEKVYLHMDKPYYVSGDTIWFKGYVLEGGENLFSTISHALYVDLIGPSDTVVVSLRLPLIGGVAQGSLPLPYVLLQGNYRMRSYTQWMRNRGSGGFFERGLTIGEAGDGSMRVSVGALSKKSDEKPIKKIAGNRVLAKSPTDTLEAEVLFFPEGGDLVEGLPSRIGVKATGPGGRGIPVSGRVLDNSGNTVADWESVHAGMGRFVLSPLAGEHYTAEVTFADGGTARTALPAAKTKGHVLEVRRDDLDSLLVEIRSSAGQHVPVGLLVQASGEVHYRADIDIRRTVTRFRIGTETLPHGVARLTLFSESGEPLSERAFFIHKKDTLNLDLTLRPTPAQVRGETSFTLLSTDGDKAVSGNFSVSVVDEGKVPEVGGDGGIMAHLLLRTEVKGPIEDPGYYFGAPFSEREEHLDLLLMTQGYRRFVWAPKDPVLYPAEPLTTSITGRLVNLRGKPVANGQVTLFSTQVAANLDTLSDREGKFSFDGLLFADDVEFTVQGKDAKGSDRVEVLFGESFPLEEVKPLEKGIGLFPPLPEVYVRNANLERGERKEQGLLPEGNMLDEVAVTGKALPPVVRSYNLNGPNRADQVVTNEELTGCPTLAMCLQRQLRGVVFKEVVIDHETVMVPYNTRGGRMLVVRDGNPLRGTRADNFELLNVLKSGDPLDVGSVEVLRSPSLTGMYGPDGVNGVILINSLPFSQRNRENFHLKQVVAKGYSKVREFYSHRYDKGPEEAKLADYRSTIYWNPDLRTDADGRGEFGYFNAGTPGTYRVVIEGLDGQGKLGRKVFRYEVKE